MLDLSPERFVQKFAGDVKLHPGLIVPLRNLVVASCVIVMERHQSLVAARDVMKEALAERELTFEPTIPRWIAEMRVVSSNIGPEPVPASPREVLLGLDFHILDYEDLSRARHPSARAAN